MKYEVQISVDKDNDLFEALKPEISKDKRHSTSIKKDKNTIKIIITAQDSTALQAHLNGIMKLIRIYEKIKKVG